MCVVIIALKIIHIFSGSNPLVMFAKASIIMNCKIQTMCVKTNVSVSFTPPEVIDEDCLKILYYHHQNFTMCQRVVEIRMNERIMDLSKQMGQDVLVIQVPGRNENVKFDYEDFLSKIIGM
jgi:hypothetical protein